MKAAIHPEYQKTTITCSCGAVYEVGSTKSNLRVEICANCHPFFTGQQRIVDTGGRVERFLRKFGEDYRQAGKGGKKKKTAAAETEAAEAAPSGE